MRAAGARRGAVWVLQGEERGKVEAFNTESLIKKISLIAEINRSELSAKEKRIVDYIFSVSPADLVRLTAEQLAQQTQTSRATILRFSQKFGFKGYRSFLHAIIQQGEGLDSSVGESPIIDPQVKLDDDVYQVTKKIISNINARTQKFAKLIHEEHVLDCFIKKVASASRIYAFGAGASALAAEDIQQRLLRLGFHIQFSPDIHTQLVMAATLSDGDVVIGYSYSGATHNTILALETAKMRGAHVVAVVGQTNTLMNKVAHQTIQMPPGVGHFGNDAAMARILQITFNEIIFTCLAKQDEKYLKNVAVTNKILDEYKHH